MSVRIPHPLPAAALAALCLAAASDAAFAQTTAGAALDSAVDRLAATLDQLGSTLGTRAQQLLLALLAVDFVWRGGKWAIGEDRIDAVFQGFLYQLAFVIMVWAFAAGVPQIVAWLAQTALDIASGAGAAEARPSAIVADGLERAVGWLGEISLVRPGTVFYVFAAGASVIVLAMAVAMIVVVYAELYIAGLAGVIALAFAGLSETRGIAVGYVKALIGKAFKLMGVLIVIAATAEITTALAVSSGRGFENAMGMLLLQIVGGVLIMTLPGALESLVSGSRLGTRSAEAVGRMAGGAVKTAAVASAAAAGGAVGGAAAAGIGVAKSGGTLGQTVKAGLTDGLKGGVRGGIDWGGIAARGEMRSEIMGRIRDMAGRGGRGR